MLYKDMSICDLFTPTLGSGVYTKEYCTNHFGEYPVFSGNTEGVFHTISDFDYEGNYLTWTKDGLAGYIMKLSGKFSITNHRGILIPKFSANEIDIDYIKIFIEPIFRANRKGRGQEDGKNEYTSLSIASIKAIQETISVPINKNGTFDIEKQRKIAERYKLFEFKKKELRKQKQSLKSIRTIELDSYNLKGTNVIDTIQSINTTYLGKGLAELHLLDTKDESDYSVWSAAEKPIAYISDRIENKLIFASEDTKVLSISANGDGSAARNLYVHTKPFYMDSGRIALIPKSDVKADYLYYVLQGIKEKYGFNRAKPVNKRNLKEVEIKMPVNDDGYFDIKIQTECVSIYTLTSKIIRETINKIDNILNTPVDLEFR